MNRRQGSGRRKLLTCLHFTMIILSAVGSFAILAIDSFFTRLLISIILIGYTLFFLTKGLFIRKYFKITPSEKDPRYQNFYKWQEQKVDGGKQKKVVTQIEQYSFSSEKEATSNQHSLSFSKSLDISVDMKNMSMSVGRSLNSSSTTESKINNIDQSRVKQSVGFRILDMFQSQQKKKGFQLRNNINPVLLDYPQCNYPAFKEQAQREFQKSLKNEVKKDRKAVSKSYDLILQEMQKTLRRIKKEHKFVEQQLKRSAQQFFECKIIASKRTMQQQLTYTRLKTNQKVKISIYFFLYRILLANSQHITIDQLGFSLKKQYQQFEFQPKLKQIAKPITKLGETMGLSYLLSYQGLREENVCQFIEEYKMCVQWASLYLQNQPTQARRMRLYNESIFNPQIAKSRIFALYLMVKNINFSLKKAPKIKFNDFMNFKYNKEEKFGFQINKKIGTEGAFVHYDLTILNEGKPNQKYCCQPGQRNYLSVLYMLFFQFSKRETLLANSEYLKALVKKFM